MYTFNLSGTKIAKPKEEVKLAQVKVDDFVKVKPTEETKQLTVINKSYEVNDSTCI